jgi:hypothetical protein
MTVWKIAYVLLIVLCLSLENCIAQSTFLKTFGTQGKEAGRCLIHSFDNGYLIGADMDSSATGVTSDVLLIKTNSSGDTLWTYIFDSGTNDYVKDVVQAADSGYVILADMIDSTNFNSILLFKINAAGSLQWVRKYNSFYGSGGNSVIQKNDLGFCFCGWSLDFNGLPQGLIVSTNLSGDTLWTKMFTYAPYYTWFYDLKQNPDSSFVLLGGAGQLDQYSIILLRTAESGDWINSAFYYYVLNDNYSTAFVPTDDHSFLIAGECSDDGISNDKRFLLKVDSLFNILWTQSFNFPKYEIYNIAATHDNGFIFIAEAKNINSSPSSYLIKTDSSGIPLWSKEFNNCYVNSRHSLLVNDDSSLVFCGTYIDTISNNHENIAVIKTDKNGNLPCDGQPVSISTGSIQFFTGFDTLFSISDIIQDTQSLIIQSGIFTSTVCFSNSIADLNSDTENSLQVYPNPFTERLNVTINDQKLSEIILYDITSRKILQQKFISSASINTSHLSKGIYIYELRNKNGVLKNGKVVKD